MSHSPTGYHKQRKYVVYEVGQAVPYCSTRPTGKELDMTAIEEKKIAEENGYEYIPPYKLNEMMKLSSKIVKLLTDIRN